MIEEVLVKLVPQYGGLAILALFAFIMLKAQLKALGDFNRTLSNHFQADQKYMDRVNESLSAILNELQELRKK